VSTTNVKIQGNGPGMLGQVGASVVRACERIGLQISNSKFKNHKPLVQQA
jgi:hypothetical protein